ncbi:TetR family transcriptional regulator, partial [Dactylosporangium sp. NPDC051485]|uniref:TetR family transcriptional regulator n=1 Tax=Dactylosporangium sp. NPDC051485 TaxID=3154846 RepID=UPI0034356304
MAAAGRLFARHGYAATTIAAIAEDAGVTPRSVYAVADKPGLLLAAVGPADAGDDVVESLLRGYPLLRAFEEAAAVEPAVREAWRRHERGRRA